ncbi:DUF397 domain-containing protein [Allosalinactinospora lopnorensis]|uniref:DUF397 domain-containing protein n=1 Tax=Allosalinactinospora lopnorensis TaxID=1352348 RepID=UPI0009E5C925|nr:DUF397 domain-containing protein [Allosalinactinospora lopnorensis]
MSARLSAATWRKSSYSGSNADCLECSSTAWHVSSHSGSNANCVEYAQLPSSVAVRDSKRPRAGHLSFPGAEWSAFLSAVRRAHL